MNKNIGDMNKEELFELCSELLDVDTDCMLLQRRIDKAKDYINERFEINEYGEYYLTHTFDKSNLKELLEILGDKENE